jgi:hypothetical protein
VAIKNASPAAIPVMKTKPVTPSGRFQKDFLKVALEGNSAIDYRVKSQDTDKCSALGIT